MSLNDKNRIVLKSNVYVKFVFHASQVPSTDKPKWSTNSSQKKEIRDTLNIVYSQNLLIKSTIHEKRGRT